MRILFCNIAWMKYYKGNIAGKDELRCLSPWEGDKFGFGQSDVWYANDPRNEALQTFLKRIIDQIKKYDRENWIDYFG